MKQGVDYPGVSIVFLCHDGGGSVLMNKRGAACRDEQGRWDIGGGGLDHGSSPIETLHKEIAEEYRATIIRHEFLGYRNVLRAEDTGVSHWVAVDFLVHIEHSGVGNGEPHKFDEVAWQRLESLPDPLHSQLPAFLDKYHAALARTGLLRPGANLPYGALDTNNTHARV